MQQQKIEHNLKDQKNHFSLAGSLSDDQLMGMLIVELLENGKSLNRKTICEKLLSWIEMAPNETEVKRYQNLMRLVLERDLN